jgi:hypothetical protein
MDSISVAAGGVEPHKSLGPLLGPRCPRRLQALVGTLVVVAALPGNRVLAQPVPTLETGARVRVVAVAASSKPVIGTIVRVDERMMELRLADRKDLTFVPRAAIKKLEVSRGRRSRGRGALIGALIGGALGAIAVLATPGQSCEPSSNPWSCIGGISKGEGALALGGLGAGLGALVGLVIPPAEKWTPVPMAQVSVAPGRQRRIQVSLSLAF